MHIFLKHLSHKRKRTFYAHVCNTYEYQTGGQYNRPRFFILGGKICQNIKIVIEIVSPLIVHMSKRIKQSLNHVYFIIKVLELSWILYRITPVTKVTGFSEVEDCRIPIKITTSGMMGNTLIITLLCLHTTESHQTTG